MPDTATKTAEARIAELEQKVEDLADFVGRVTAGIFGNSFHAKYDCAEDGLLVWKEVPADPDDPEDMDVGWWTYKAPEEASVDA